MKAEFAVLLAHEELHALNSKRHVSLHEVCGKPMLRYALDLAQAVSNNVPVVATGYDAEAVEAFINSRAEAMRVGAEAENANALYEALQGASHESGYALVLMANAPLIKEETLLRLIEASKGEAASALIESRPEESEKGEEEPARECAAYCVSLSHIKGFHGSIRALLTALRQKGHKVVNVYAEEIECMQVINRATLWECGYLMQSRVNARHMLAGVTLLGPINTLIDADVTIGRDTLIYPGVVLSGSTQIGEDCVLYDGCRLKDTKIGQGCVLQSVVAAEAVLGDRVTVGPFVHLRPGTRLGNDCKVGDFNEVKNSTIGDKTKLPHFSYIGDADIGARVNVGCGCVTVNYDGFHKHRTTVGDDVFLGCQTNLVAPVTVGNDAYTAAGSTITKDVPPGALAVARAHQENKEGWVEKNRALRRKKD